MENEEVKKAEIPEFHEQNRHFEEQLLNTKDGILRLWERNRYLQERLGQVEQRLKRLTWLLLAVVAASVGAVAFMIRFYQPSLPEQPQPDQLGELQAQKAELVALRAQVTPLQERVQALERAGQDKPAESDQSEKELSETIEKLAPAILAATLQKAIHVDEAGNVGVGTENPQAPLHVVGNLLGAAKGPADEALRIVAGQLDPKKVRWVQYTEGGIYVDVDTASAGFSSTPLYFTSLGGHTNNWLAQGATSIYYPTPQGFRVHISYPELTVAKAKEWGWYISWVAIGK